MAERITEDGNRSDGLRVDPTALQNFARYLDDHAAGVRGIGARTALTGASVPGTEVDTMLGRCADVVSAAHERIAGRLDAVAQIARGAAGHYEVTDVDFRRGMDDVGAAL